MQKRIFIAINLPAELKKQILGRQKKWFTPSGIEGLAFGLNLTKPENLHITLAFIGDVEENDIGKVFKASEDAVKSFKPFEIKLGKIHLGPNENFPRMIWLSGLASKDLIGLAGKLAENLKKNGIAVDAKHDFKLHITLARTRENELAGKNIKENLDYSFVAESIEVMESRLGRGGAEYQILKKIKFG